jgi:hypothetical protein
VVQVDVGNGPEIAQLMGDVRAAVGLEHEPGTELMLRTIEFGRRDAVGPHVLERINGSSLHGVERHAITRRDRDGIQERVLGRDEHTEDGGRQPAFDKCPVETRVPLRRVPVRRPEVDTLRPREHRIEHQHREEIGVGRLGRVIGQFQIGGRPLFLDGDAPLAELCRFDGANPRWIRAGRDLPKVPLDAAQDVIGIHVADDHQRCVVGNVVLPVMPVQVVAGHRLEVAQPPDGGVPVRVGLESRRRYLGVEQLFRIVVAPVQLGNDHGALRLAVLRVE